MDDKELEQFCRAAVVLYDAGFPGPARTMMAAAFTLPEQEKPQQEQEEPPADAGP